jgi:hypothetical protein
MESQARCFREKFGRNPGPEDMIFFDPDADEPRPHDPNTFTREMTEELRRAGAEARIDLAFIEAWCELGYVVTEENRHLFSAGDVVAWDEAVRRHAGDLDEDDDDLDGEEESGKVSLDASLDEISDGLERVVAAIVADKTLDAARRLIGVFADLPENLDEEDSEDGDVAGWTFQATFAVLAGWLTGAREKGLSEADAKSTLDWVRSIDTAADNATDYALRVAGLIGHPGAPQSVTVDQMFDEIGPVLIGAMVLIAAGLVATVGGDDAYWLRQFDLESSADGDGDDK